MKYIIDRNVAIAILVSTIFFTVIMSFLSRELNPIVFIGCLGIITVYSTVLSAIFGSVAGIASSFIASIIVNIILGQHVSFSNVIIMLVYGGWIGYFAKDFKIRDAKFKKGNIIGLNVIVIIISIVLYVMIRPLVRFFLSGSNVYDDIMSGTMTLLFLFLLTVFVSTPILVVVNRIYMRNKRAEE